jgi:hypothetical protein
MVLLFGSESIGFIVRFKIDICLHQVLAFRSRLAYGYAFLRNRIDFFSF